MGFDLMNWCNDNQNICIFIVLLIVLQCTGHLTQILNMFGLEGFDLGNGSVSASEPLGQNEVFAAVKGVSVSSTTSLDSIIS